MASKSFTTLSRLFGAKKKEKWVIQYKVLTYFKYKMTQVKLFNL